MLLTRTIFTWECAAMDSADKQETLLTQGF